MKFDFPSSPPHENIIKIHQLQNQLMAEAEFIFGKKGNVHLGMPVLAANGPQVFHSIDGSEAWAQLGPYAANYWPTTVYQLAHETVHLLNPVIGPASYFEEGIAVKFADYAVSYTDYQGRMSDLALPEYKFALALIENIFLDSFAVAKHIRNEFGALSKANPLFFKEKYSLTDSIAQTLCALCVYS